MRHVILASLLVTAILAGCAANDAPSSTTTGPAPVRSLYALDCTIANWNETCLALASPNDSLAKAEVDIAVNPTDPNNVFIASKDRDPLASRRTDNNEPCVWAVGQYTKDGGKTWNTTYIGKTLAERLPTDVLYGWECITDPILAFEPDGTLHYSLQAYRYRPAGAIPDPTCTLPTGCQISEGGHMFQAISHDGGVTFPDILVMHAGDSNNVFHDFMRMGVNPVTSTTFTIWDQLTGAGAVGAYQSLPVLVAVESGNTQSARSPVYFPSSDPELVSGGVGAVFGVDDGTADGIVYAWLAGFNSGGKAVLSTSTDDGLTFSDPRVVFSWRSMASLEAHGDYEPQYRTVSVVELAADRSTGDSPNKGCLYAVWGGRETIDGNDTVGPSDIYTRRSCDKGETWAEPVLINSNSREDGQWMPRVSVDGHGAVHVVYYTRAYDLDHNLIDAEHAYSTDGGRNWTVERLTSQSFDGNLGLHQNGFPFIGDYIGIDSWGDHTFMGFSHTATGRAELVVGHSVRNA